MSLCRIFTLSLALLLVSGTALAQDIDEELLAPLTPGPKAKLKKRKPRPVTRPRPQPSRPDDDMLAPLSRGTELMVRLPSGLEGAQLYVDERLVGPLPGSALPVSAGSHHVVVRRPGFRDFSRQVQLKEGQTLELTAQLDATAAVVTVQANVEGALVRINGTPLGRVPLQGLLLAPGSHEIRVSSEGYGEELSRISVRAGKDYQFHIQLRALGSGGESSARVPAEALGQDPQSQTLLSARETPWFKRWYVWAGAGAVVATAVVTTLVLTRDNNPAFSPTQACAPDACDAVLALPGGGAHF